MKKQLEELTGILLGDLSDSIYKDTEIIDKYAKKINQLLDIKRGSQDELLTTHISETVIAPLPFWGYSENDKVNFVHLNLSPIYGKNIHLEKQEAGDLWATYFNYFTSGKDCIHDMNIIKLLYVLFEDHEEGKITVEDIQQKLELSKDDLFGYFSSKGLMFASLVPFHSHGFDTNANGIEYLENELPSYKKYLQRLMTHIKYNMTENGILFCNNYSESRIARSLLEKKGATVLVENDLLTLMKWESKTAVLLNDHLNTRRGLRSDQEIDKVMTLVKNIDNQGHAQLETFCNELLQKRADDDHKQRGQRIKGTKLKKIAIKNIRKTGE